MRITGLGGQPSGANLAPHRPPDNAPPEGSTRPFAVGQAFSHAVAPAATRECVVPRSIPTAMRRLLGVGDCPGSEICKSAMEFLVFYVVTPAIGQTQGPFGNAKPALLSQLLAATLNVVGKSRPGAPAALRGLAR